MEIELTEQGYLRLPVELAQHYFPEDVLVTIVKQPELWLLPLRGAAAGGLLLKQYNLRGDRSVLIWEQLPACPPPGRYPAFWDDEHRALRVALRLIND